MIEILKEKLYENKFNLSLKGLRASGHSPLRIELAQIDSVFITNFVGHSALNLVMNEQSTTGFAKSKHKSRLIALSEWVERLAVKQGVKEHPYRFRQGSDGCAAQPIYLGQRKRAQQIARARALAEATERFVWSIWADDTQMGHSVGDFEINSPMIQELNQACPIEFIREVAPQMRGAQDIELRILIAFLRSGGVLTAGAAGPISEREHTRFRALAELLRHALGVERFNKNNWAPNDLYEERLLFLQSAKGRELVESRLAERGSEFVQLPPLEFDSEISNPVASHFLVHQCLYENQPGFISGAVEKMCL